MPPYPLNDILGHMPFLIRVALQRIAIGAVSLLGFWGVNPDIAPPTPELVQEVQFRQDGLVDQVLSPAERSQTTPDTSEAAKRIQNIEQKIVDTQRELTETLTLPITEGIAREAVPSAGPFAQQDAGFSIEDVVVNVVCMEKTIAYTKLSTGSGVVISPTGLVLTNAHVAYPFLQSPQFDRNTYSCSVRRENIPNFGYNAEIVYYPIDWLNANSEVIKDPSPVGTGEDDYAILAITTPIGPAPRSTSFQAASLAVSVSDLRAETPVTVAGYPSVNSGVFDVDANPGLKVAQSTIKEFFTFSTRSLDIMQTGVNQVARRGSSGGGVFSGNNLYGLIVTTNQNDEGSYVNALTLPYIKQDFRNDTGQELDEFVSKPLDSLVSQFSSTYKIRLQDLISQSLEQ